MHTLYAGITDLVLLLRKLQNYRLVFVAAPLLYVWIIDYYNVYQLNSFILPHHQNYTDEY